MRLSNLLLILFCFTLGHTQSYAQLNDKINEPLSQTRSGQHHIALFNGATSNFTHNTTAYTVGLDYEYRLSKLIGLGVLGELILTESEEILAGIAVIVHPFKGLKFSAAPLVAFAEEHAMGHEAKKKASFLFRVGVGYDFHVWKLSYGPAVNFDFGKTESLNYGLAMGYSF
ncbi:hypothetical protein ES711_00895 [Gelidibacter salicanalis]|uniref:Porin family protein n=1 Tax=Gelidibacter salicanalis TaxID=291193 RepID=A0A5C7AQ19_9FLAO|nr:hypothetical protein [Gelidibacter salicanalis]TXE10497.1 hypothetical protein ES711_00895 [Gelidibacter salicanalis]